MEQEYIPGKGEVEGYLKNHNIKATPHKVHKLEIKHD